jgi:protein-tyrosine phosphatase
VRHPGLNPHWARGEFQRRSVVNLLSGNHNPFGHSACTQARGMSEEKINPRLLQICVEHHVVHMPERIQIGPTHLAGKHVAHGGNASAVGPTDTMGPMTSHMTSATGTHRILFVCLGNICRSPMAQAVLMRRAAESLPNRVQVESAGTGSWHVDSPADSRAMAALQANGYTLEHRARQVHPTWLSDRVVIAMDRQNLADLRAIAPAEIAQRIRLFRSWDPSLAHIDPDGPEAHLLDVPDPYYGSAADYEAVLTMVERAADGLIAELSALTE